MGNVYVTEEDEYNEDGNTTSDEKSNKTIYHSLDIIVDYLEGLNE